LYWYVTRPPSDVIRATTEAYGLLAWIKTLEPAFVVWAGALVAARPMVKVRIKKSRLACTVSPPKK